MPGEGAPLARVLLIEKRAARIVARRRVANVTEECIAAWAQRGAALHVEAAALPASEDAGRLVARGKVGKRKVVVRLPKLPRAEGVRHDERAPSVVRRCVSQQPLGLMPLGALEGNR